MMNSHTIDQSGKEHAAILYGMQRSGSNYIQQVLLQNFQNITFYNNSFSRCLPTHKHFRLYDEKSAIPDARFFNTFTYKGFEEFRKHVEQVAGREIDKFVIIIKDPYSWYVSYKKHARKNKYLFFKHSINSHYIIDYNLFYKKWLTFSREAPGDVLLVKYEDLIDDLETSIERIGQKMHMERSSEKIVNPEKVRMNKRYTATREAFYKNKKYLELISDREKSVIQHLLDRELLSTFDYKIVS